MGRTMAPAAAMTLKQHLEDFQIELDEYDLILTGDLSKYGSEVFIEIMKEFSYTIGGNYDDAGKCYMILKIKKYLQEEVDVDVLV